MVGGVRLLLAAIAGVWLATAAAPAAAATRPNVVVILADDLGYGDVGAYGSRAIRTPAIDRMAREGARLTSFFASANVCTPSRAGLLTGRYAARSGLAVGVIHAHSTYGLPESEVTIAEMLRAAGYRTAMLGKWHLGSKANYWPTAHGFDSFWGVPWSNDMSPLPLYRGTAILEEPLVQETFAERLVAEARAVIEAESDQPFFLYVSHIAPHVPLRPGTRFRGKSKAGLYGDFVEEMDWTTGEILAALRRAGKDRDTLVILTSDNGPWFEGSSGPLRDRKGSTFEGGFGVPFVARWPCAIPRGLVSDQMAMNIDLLPTIAAATGAAVPADRPIDGRNILPLLTERGQASPHERLLFFSNAAIAAVRTQDWRLVVRSFYATVDVPFEALGYRLLFDMRADRGETVSVWHLFPAVAARLEAMLSAARAEFAGLPQQRTDLSRPAPIQLPAGERPAPAAPQLPTFGDQPPIAARANP
jgi:arylsulfatase A